MGGDPVSYSESQQRSMLDLARHTLRETTRLQQSLELEDLLGQNPDWATSDERRAAFVTLKLDDQLRGCSGTLEPIGTLAEGIVYSTCAAAIRDPRFPPVAAKEEPHIDIHISVLTEPTPVEIVSEKELVARLRVHVDGVVLEDGIRRATFLPSVWESVEGPQDFVRQLKYKGGWRDDEWPEHMRVSLYQAESVPSHHP